ncbi:MAG: hypothetical protein AAGD96_34105, partial [Chloroflexota bacterium]
MLRLAWCSPLPPTRSGIADYSVEFLAELSQHAEISLFVDDPAAVDAPSISHLPCYRLDHLNKHRFDFDLPIYHMGNHASHRHIYQQAIQNPGIVVLHEFVLNSHWAELQTDLQRQDALVQELIYEQEWQKKGQFSFLEMVDNPPPSQFNQRLIKSSLGLITHSQFTADQVKSVHPAAAVYVSKLI